MINDSRVSVIVPTYNREKWILRSLNSIKNQSYNNYEIIVIDDGSADDTQNIVREFSKTIDKSNIKYFKFNKNGGIPRALNKGYELSSGKYVCQLSSDDQWITDKLEKQVAILDSDPKIGLIYSDYLFEEFDDGDNTLRAWRAKVFSGNKSEMCRRLFTDCFMNACTFLMRKDFKNSIGPYPMRPEFEWNQDLWFNFQCVFSDFNIHYQEDMTAKISIHSNQASKQGKCGLGNDVLLPEMHKESIKRKLING